MKKVKAKVKLLKHQKKFVECNNEYPALIGGFGSGKTESAIFRALHFVFKYGPEFKKYGKEYVYGMYEPTYDLIKLILYPRLEEILNNMNLKYSLNKSDKVLTIHGKGKIIFRSLENPERIIGYEHADCGIDELDTLKKDKAKEVFEKIIARNRLKKFNNERNTVSVTTTPEGFRFIYEKWGKATNPEKYYMIKAKTKDNIFLPSNYIDDLKEQYPKELIEAYLNGEFVNLNAKTVYYCFDRFKNNTTIELSEEDNEIHVGMDFNVGKMSAVVGIIISGKMYIVDEIFGAKDTPEIIEILKKKYEGKEIYIYPDSAGNARKTVNASETDISLLKNAGFIVRERKKNPRVKDRVLTVNGAFENAKAKRRLFINTTKCPLLTENLEQQSYDKNGEPEKVGDVDHMLDALGYLVYYFFEIKKTKSGIIKDPT